VAVSRSFSKNTRKLSLYTVFIMELFSIHVELEFGMLGIARKLVKNVIQLWWCNFGKNLRNCFL
jgi:hypothetical protein